MYRVGIGQDSHRFEKGREKPLVLGGIRVASSGGLAGNSDADVILHSLCNALSSAVGGDSLSTWSDKMLDAGVADSQKYLGHIFQKIKTGKYKIENVSMCIEAKKPYFTPAITKKIKESIADLLEINSKQVGITFTSGEDLTPFGKGLAVQCLTQVLISR